MTGPGAGAPLIPATADGSRGVPSGPPVQTPRRVGVAERRSGAEAALASPRDRAGS